MPRPLKWILWIVGGLVSFAVGTVLLLAWFFSGLIGEPSKDEVARVVSPSGNIDAVLFETNGGATTSFGYEVTSWRTASNLQARRQFRYMVLFEISTRMAPTFTGHRLIHWSSNI
ncbi:MAG: hypothetical protein JNL84_04855 [Candidatus Accumulibacter sp.]|nr:hypothetical protein [Accumulibacter sp.]